MRNLTRGRNTRGAEDVMEYNRGINRDRLYWNLYVRMYFSRDITWWKSWVCFAGPALQAVDPHD